MPNVIMTEVERINAYLKSARDVVANAERQAAEDIKRIPAAYRSLIDLESRWAHQHPAEVGLIGMGLGFILAMMVLQI